MIPDYSVEFRLNPKTMMRYRSGTDFENQDAKINAAPILINVPIEYRLALTDHLLKKTFFQIGKTLRTPSETSVKRINVSPARSAASL